MRPALLLALLLAFVIPSAAVAEKPKKVADDVVVKDLELSRFQAAEKNDLDTLGKLLADDLTYTHSTGVLETKEIFLGSLKSGKLQFKKIEPADLQVRVYGTTALINGTAKFSVVSNGEAKEVHIRFTDVWASRAGRWQLVAWQSTKLP
jgi:hypothetical protein